MHKGSPPITFANYGLMKSVSPLGVMKRFSGTEDRAMLDGGLLQAVGVKAMRRKTKVKCGWSSRASIGNSSPQMLKGTSGAGTFSWPAQVQDKGIIVPHKYPDPGSKGRLVRACLIRSEVTRGLIS